MAFVSLSFLLFVVVSALVYFAVPLKHRWAVLLIASYVYFWFNSEWLVLILFATTLITFFDVKAIF